MCCAPALQRGNKMGSALTLGDLICCLYEEYSEQYGDNDLAALAADVELNDLLMLFDVHDLQLE